MVKHWCLLLLLIRFRLIIAQRYGDDCDDDGGGDDCRWIALTAMLQLSIGPSLLCVQPKLSFSVSSYSVECLWTNFKIEHYWEMVLVWHATVEVIDSSQSNKGSLSVIVVDRKILSSGKEISWELSDHCDKVSTLTSCLCYCPTWCFPFFCSRVPPFLSFFLFLSLLLLPECTFDWRHCLLFLWCVCMFVCYF